MSSSIHLPLSNQGIMIENPKRISEQIIFDSISQIIDPSLIIFMTRLSDYSCGLFFAKQETVDRIMEQYTHVNVQGVMLSIRRFI